MKQIAYLLVAIAILTGCSTEKTQPQDASNNKTVSIPEHQTAKETPVPNASEAAGTPEGSGMPSAESEPGQIENAATGLFDIKLIAGKSEEEVSAVLGTPIQSENGERTLLSTEKLVPYRQNDYTVGIGTISVMFMDEKAVRIKLSIEKGAPYKYPDDMLKVMEALGLTVNPASPPAKKDAVSASFTYVDGFYLLQMKSDSPENPSHLGEVVLITEDLYE
ncbi:hypothetical protein [Brevibacillus borstelensis]|uniref:hypothetical protein n=1 Tax=Brevibacillus borstelensis TaxID=45462 RepID=UPI0030BE1033